MKIFVGGLMPSRQQRIRQLFPDVDLTFTSDQDGNRRWLTRAKSADVVIVDQGRCDHTIINLFNKHKVRVQFADGNAAIQRIILGVINGIRPDQATEENHAQT